MKVTIRSEEFKLEATLVVCFDVSKDKLNYFFCYRDATDGQRRECEAHFSNRTPVIERQLREFRALGQQQGLPELLVVCEPTGGYERSLLKTAHRLGLRTAYVNPESVNKLQVVQSNDNGKTDEKDPRTIHTLAAVGKTLKQRPLPEPYLQLRRLHGFYEDEVDAGVRLRGHLQAVLQELFCDYAQSADFLYTKTGKALLDRYGFNPYRIVADRWGQFVRKLQRHSHVRLTVLEAIYQAAKASSLHRASAWEQEVLEQRLRQLYQDWERHEQRKAELRQQMTEIFSRLPEHQTLGGIPKVSAFHLARLVAQTGPLSDFRHSAQLVRLSGLNLRERRSGKYVGQLKISKKGRALLRKVLYQVCFGCLIGKGRLYHAYYQAHVNPQQSHSAMRTMVSVMRKFVKLLHGVHRSRTAFNPARVLVSASEFARQQKPAA